ncbi:MAG: Na(+)/H(+) antiporter subunit B [Pseudomonadota bacterium]
MEHHLILRVVTRLLVAPILLYGLYVQWHGDYGPGGGFQAGVIFAVAFILYGIVFNLRTLREMIPDRLVHVLLAFGVLLYSGVGVVSMFNGGTFLDYDPLFADRIDGQHYGILMIEFGVGVTVFGVMMAIYYSFAGRPPSIDDKDW